MCAHQAERVLGRFLRGGIRGLDEGLSQVSGNDLQGGNRVVIESHGGPGREKPPLHCMATSGGWESQAPRWLPLDDAPTEGEDSRAQQAGDKSHIPSDLVVGSCLRRVRNS
jgi:hypothetical protein